ncbi:T9SS type A sorting domain-containing protein [uncultured Dokdonia sp.]|uniref:T9SS type A sorting domain-containing protein n=1 Tax=uncultured Dokdonia sp. TaxID=575653 RepID=UPI00261CAC0C|nr:T9SS type A sorting domain-containing protein [uncultured Dokdonia sp.]
MKKTTFLLLLICIPFISISQVSPVVTGLADPFDVVIQGSDAYVAEFSGNAIVRVDLTATNPTAEDVVTGINGPTSLLFDGDDVYISQVGGVITRRDASDLTSNQVTIASGLVTPVSMVRIDNDLYFSEFQGGRIGRIDLTTGAISTVINGLNFPEQIVLIGDELFIAHAGANRVSKFNVTDTTPTLEDVVIGLNNPAGIHAEGTILLVTEFVTNGSIFRIDTSETSPTAIELVSNQDNPFGVSFFNDDLYFVQNGAGILSRFEGNVLSVSDQTLENIITVFPNPSQGQFSIRGLQGKTFNDITIIDVTGRIVKQYTPQDSVQNVFDYTLSSGTYFLAVTTVEGRFTERLIIQ